MFSTLISVAALAVGLVNAQATNFSMTPGQYTVDPNSVSITLRNSWCNSQRTTCLTVCGTATANDCDPNELKWNCQCQGGITPNISSYQQSLPGQECLQWQGDCQLYYGNLGDAQSQQTICQAVVCGNQIASATGGSSSSSAAPSTTSAPASSSSSPASMTTSTSSSASAASATPTHSPGAAAGLTVSREFSTAVFGAGILMAFGLAL